MSKEDLQAYIDWCVHKFLSYRPRTEKETRNYIQRKITNKTAAQRFGDEISSQLAHEITSSVVESLKERNVLNDADFTSWFVTERMTFKPKGVNGLKFELRGKGVPQDVIDEYFENNNVDVVSPLAEIVEKKFANKNLSDFKEKKKAYDYLSRRGFSYGDIKKAIEELMTKE